MAKSQAKEAATKKGKTAKSSTTASKATSEKNEQTLEFLFVKGLKEIYNAEKQLIEALPKMAEAAYSEDLENAFNEHLQVTERQAERLEKIFDRLRIEKEEEPCIAMEGLIEEGKKIISEFEESPVRDSALIIGAQKIEHFEIAAYGSLCELADVLGYSRISEALERTLEEEKETDEELSFIAQDINDEAYELSQQEEKEEVEVY